MVHDIKIPELGESITEGILAEWLRKDGDLVEEGEAVADLETDKVTMQITAPRSGRLSTKVEEGDTVQIGQVVATVDDAEAAEAAAQSQRKPALQTAGAAATMTEPPATPATLPGRVGGQMPGPYTPSPAAERAPAPAGGPPLVPTAGPAQATAKLGGATGVDVPLSPAVRKLVTEQGIDPRQIKATGQRGRLTKGDVLRHVGGQGPLDPRSSMVTTPSPAGGPQRAGAAASGAAAVRTAVAVTATAAAASPPATGPGPHTAAPETSAVRQSRQRLTPLRQRVAERLLMAKQQTAMLTTFNETDMSAVLAYRTQHQEAFEKRHGVRLGFSSFFIKAAVDALRTVPGLNAYIDGDELVTNHFFDIGMAVSTEKGLMVPVLRDCDRLGFADIERGVADFAARARNRTITLDDLSGGCFTISNGGVFGSLLSTPILNPPQSGILGLHAIKKRPVVVDDQIVIRPMMYLALSYDHRVVDGREAVTFLRRVAECIENPERMMLEV